MHNCTQFQKTLGQHANHSKKYFKLKLIQDIFKMEMYT